MKTKIEIETFFAASRTRRNQEAKVPPQLLTPIATATEEFGWVKKNVVKLNKQLGVQFQDFEEETHAFFEKIKRNIQEKM